MSVSRKIEIFIKFNDFIGRKRPFRLSVEKNLNFR